MTLTKKKNVLKEVPVWLFLAVYGVFLLKFRDTAIAGTLSGAYICLNVIICCVFPFMVVSAMFVSTGMCGALGKLGGKAARRLFGLSGSGVGVVLLGLCGGYPSGAYAACELYEKGAISKKEAQTLVLYTNNASPAFIISYVGSFLGGAPQGLFAWLCVISSALLCGVLLKGRCEVSGDMREPEPESFVTGLVRGISASAENVVVICGFVLFFSVTASALSVIGMPKELQAALYAAIELTGGIQALCAILGSGRLACSVLCAVCAFSGLCVFAQVASVCGSHKIPYGKYLFAKLLQAGIAFILSFALYGIFFA